MDKMYTRMVSSVYFMALAASITTVRAEITEYDVLEHMFAEEPKALLTRPPGLSGLYSDPVNVNFSAYIYRIDKVDEINMELQIYLYYRMTWVDPRLTENRINLAWSSESNLKYVTLPCQYHIWYPDVVFLLASADGKRGETVPYSTTLVYPNGTVEYGRSGPLTVKCPMNLKKYPFDIQVCNLKIITARTTKQEVTLWWKEHQPLTFAPALNSLYTFDHYLTDVIDYETNTGEYSGIIASLLFTRNFHVPFVKFYLPVLIIVCVSWTQFSLNGLSEARLAIALSTTLILSWFYLSTSDQLTISYTTYLDTWRAINYLFVFVAAAESFYVMNKLKFGNLEKYLDDDDKDKEKSDDVFVEEGEVKPRFKLSEFIILPKRVEDLDVKCSLYFPMAYGVFIFLHWLSVQVFNSNLQCGGSSCTGLIKIFSK